MKEEQIPEIFILSLVIFQLQENLVEWVFDLKDDDKNHSTILDSEKINLTNKEAASMASKCILFLL